jgi:formate dehydrogenase major subunit
LALPAVDFLAAVTEGRPPQIGSDVIVVGGGNTAMDAARTAVRLGAKAVKVFYRRSRKEMPCLMEEVEAAEAEGVHIELLVAPVRLNREGTKLRLTCQRMELGPPDESGRRRPVAVAGSDFTVEATCVIAAIGQTVELPAAAAPGVGLSKWGIAVNPQTLATNLKGVFAGGDAVTGPDVAIRAVAAGKLAAVSIDQYLSGRGVIGAPEPVNVMMGRLGEEELAILFRQIDARPRARMPELPLSERRSTFKEVDLGLPDDAALSESGRCLGCGCWKATSCRLREYASEYHTDVRRFAGQRRHFNRDASHPEIVYESGKCIVCGVCVQVAAAAGEEFGLTIVERGFETVVAVPFGQTMAEGLKKSARRAAELCPTGAIALKGQGCGACGLH